jgi:hypothetical protein
MNDQDKEYLRDIAAMFAMTGWIMNGDYSKDEIPSLAYEMADAMMEARKPKESAGLPAIRRRVKKGE